MAAGSFMATRIMHRLSMEFGASPGGTVTPSRERSTIALAIVKIVIDVPVETIWSVIPRPRTDKHAA
jgi:hypothetical protein